MNLYKYIIHACLLIVMVLAAFNAQSKVCSLEDFLYVLGNPHNSAIYQSAYTLQRVRIAISYNESRHELDAKYAQANPDKIIELIGAPMKDGILSMHPVDANGVLGHIDLKFKNYRGQHYNHNNSSCNIINGKVYFTNKTSRKLMLVIDGVNSPKYINQQTINEHAALKLKYVAKTESKGKLSKMFEYPAFICRPNHPGVALKIYSPSDVLAYYSIIMSRGEKKFIASSVPYNLNTNAIATDFAQKTIIFQNGLIGRMCVQNAFAILRAMPCRDCF